MKDRPEYIVVARFGRPRGVSGEIYLRQLSNNPERFSKPGTFWIEETGGYSEINLTAISDISGKLVVRVEGIYNPEQAKRLTNSFLYIRSEDLPQLPDGEYYDFDLIGCRVKKTEGEELGWIAEIEPYPANDVWVIEDKKGERHMFPAVREFVEKVDIEEQLIIINPPEGIFESPDQD